MIFYFDWYGSQGYLNYKAKTEVENKLKKEIKENSEHNEQFRPCHPSSVTVINLNIEGSLSDLVGNVMCKCGRPYLTIKGTILLDGSQKIAYTIVKK